MPPRLTYLSSQPAKQESLIEWVLRCSPNSSYLHKNLPQPDCCYFLGDNRDSTSSLFKFRGMKLDINSAASVFTTHRWLLHASITKGKGFFVFPSASCKHYSFYKQQTRSWHFAHEERFAAVPPIFSTILDCHSIFLCTISHDHCQNPINRGTNFLVGRNSSLRYTLAEDFNSSIFPQLPFFPKMLQTLTKQERKTNNTKWHSPTVHNYFSNQIGYININMNTLVEVSKSSIPNCHTSSTLTLLTEDATKQCCHLWPKRFKINKLNQHRMILINSTTYPLHTQFLSNQVVARAVPLAGFIPAGFIYKYININSSNLTQQTCRGSFLQFLHSQVPFRLMSS